MSGAKIIPSLFSCIVIMVLALMQTTSTFAQDTPQDYLAGHNAARAAVGVADMSWNYTVQAYAEDYANQRSADCSLTHSQGGPYGENLYGGVGGTEFYAADAVASWVSEGQYYDYNTNSCSLGGNNCGHYTQVVWRDSTQLGCARVVCDNNAGMFIICSYYPRGNWIGQRPY